MEGTTEVFRSFSHIADKSTLNDCTCVSVKDSWARLEHSGESDVVLLCLLCLRE
jgi:hypothetical protein